MKVVGLITEYNPFHNGHQFHMEEAKRRTNADYVIVVMSGDFVQRGTPAILPKHERAKMALLQGADLVLELPVCYATSSAESFALGSVSLLEHLHLVDDLVFGSECGDLTLLNQFAHILSEEPTEYKDVLSTFLNQGTTFPTARKKALESYLDLTPEQTDVLQNPNNILGIEYLKAIHTLSSTINPYTITRIHSDYHDTCLNHTVSSATAIRNASFALDSIDHMDTLRPFVPESVLCILSEQLKKTFPLPTDCLSSFLQYAISTQTSEELSQYFDCSMDLAKRIKINSLEMKSFSEFAMLIKTKEQTLTRINRTLLHILLRIKTSDMKEFEEYGYSQCARILGFRNSSTALLKMMKQSCDIPIITKVADAAGQLNDRAKNMFEYDLFASHLYRQLIFQEFSTVLPTEYQIGPVIV